MEFTYPNEVAMKKVPLKQHSKSPFISLTNNIGNIITSNNLIACPCAHICYLFFDIKIDFIGLIATDVDFISSLFHISKKCYRQQEKANQIIQL